MHYINHIAFEMFLLNLAYKYIYIYMWQTLRQDSRGNILVLLPNIKPIFMQTTYKLAHENIVLITLSSSKCSGEPVHIGTLDITFAAHKHN